MWWLDFSPKDEDRKRSSETLVSNHHTVRHNSLENHEFCVPVFNYVLRLEDVTYA
jgi:hypothetical protein